MPTRTRLQLFSNNYFCKSAQSLRSSCRNVWRMWILFMIERGNPSWEDSRVPRLCQAWSTQTFRWIMIIMLTKIFYCTDTENELKSYHNKTDWLNFVWMQDSWMLLKSDSISWRKILQNSHNSQMQWFVVSTLCQEMKKHLNEKGRIRGNTKIVPVLEVTICCLQGKYGVEIGIMSMNKVTILTRGSVFLMG